ncbi:MAG: DUF2806 domain-containing protein [Ferrovibrio sp.]
MAPGEQFAIRLLELAAQAFGGAVEPWQIKRRAKALAEADRTTRLLAAQAEQELKQVRAGEARIVDGAVVPIDNPVGGAYLIEQADAPRLIQMAQAASEADAARRVLNLASIFEKARDEGPTVDDTTETAEKPVDPDWFVRWRLNAQDVSDELMQQLWARLLAGEIQRPGAFSLKTLEILSQMTRDDANAVADLGQYVISGSLYRHRPNKTPPFPYPSFEDILRFEEMGMISGGTSGVGLALHFSSALPDKFVTMLKAEDYLLYVEGDDASKILKFDNYRLTRPCLELLRVCKPGVNLDYMRGVGRILMKQGFKVGLGQRLRVPNGGEFFNPASAEWLAPSTE